MSEVLSVAFLCVLQGVAEFLPISSSGHLVLGRSLVGMREAGLRLDIFLHVGTLLAVFVFYRATVIRLMRGLFVSRSYLDRAAAIRYVAKILLSAVPVGLVGIFLKDAIEDLFSGPRMVGCALLFTGLVLSLTRFLPKGGGEVTFFRALLMGIAQAVAILPGVSRSGMTLAAARTAKVDGVKSAEFSFLMSAPPIVGAALFEIYHALKAVDPSSGAEVGWGLCALGALFAALVGYYSLKLLVRTLQGRFFWLFGPYCMLVGVLALVLS